MSDYQMVTGAQNCHVSSGSRCTPNVTANEHDYHMVTGVQTDLQQETDRVDLLRHKHTAAGDLSLPTATAQNTRSTKQTDLPTTVPIDTAVTVQTNSIDQLAHAIERIAANKNSQPTPLPKSVTASTLVFDGKIKI